MVCTKKCLIAVFHDIVEGRPIVYEACVNCGAIRGKIRDDPTLRPKIGKKDAILVA